MKMKSLVLLAMAIGCGFVAMLGVQQVISGEKKPLEETAKVLIAVTDIVPGQPLDDTNVVFKEWPKNQIPEGAVTSRDQYAERSLRVSAVPNELIMTAKLNEKGVFGGSSEIPEGMRVATVPVTVTKTHSGLILPGDRVDVVVTYKIDVAGRGQIQKAKTILQYIEIFATDNVRQSAVSNGENKEVSAKNISLLVTPDQYNLLMLAETKGQISLALRHRGDDAEVHPADFDETMFEQMKFSRINNKGQSTESANSSLDDEQKQIAAAPKKEEKKVEPKEQPKPTWKLRVFEGDKLREEEVELPPDPEGAATNSKRAGGRWQEFLKGFVPSAS